MKKSQGSRNRACCSAINDPNETKPTRRFNVPLLNEGFAVQNMA